MSTVPANVPIQLYGKAISTNDANTAVPCSGLTWSVSPPVPANVLGQGCVITASFPLSPSTQTVTLNAVYDAKFGTIEEKGAASKTLTIVSLPPGVHIVQAMAVDPTTGSQVPFPPLEGQSLRFNVFYLPQPIQLLGQVIGGPVPAITTWTVTDSNNQTTTIGSGLSLNWSPAASGTYTITMTTTDNGKNVYGSVSMTVQIAIAPR
jgi:hypothetical protein